MQRVSFPLCLQNQFAHRARAACLRLSGVYMRDSDRRGAEDEVKKCQQCAQPQSLLLPVAEQAE
jgi:hypothetical protein